MELFLTIIIPAYNEEENFKKGLLEKAALYLQKKPYSYEVIIVDDGSTDKTAALINDFIKKKKDWYLIKEIHGGKAAAIKRGVEAARGKNILFTDFDQATPLSEIDKLMPFLKKDYDIIIGSREVKGSKREKEPFYRHLMGKGFNLIIKLVVFGGIQDTQCGFKLFKTQVAKDLFINLRVSHLETKRAFTGAFDVELLFLAQKYGYRIAEVPVFWQHYSTKRVNPIKDSLRMFLDVLRIRFFDLLGKYENQI